MNHTHIPIILIVALANGCSSSSKNAAEEQPVDDEAVTQELIEATESPIANFHGIRASFAEKQPIYALVPEYIEDFDLSISAVGKNTSGPEKNLTGGFSFTFSGRDVNTAIAAIASNKNTFVVECSASNDDCRMIPIAVNSANLISFYVYEDRTYSIVNNLVDGAQP